MIIDETIHEVEVKRKVDKPSGRPMGYNEPYPDPYRNPATADSVTAESICNAAMDILGAK